MAKRLCTDCGEADKKVGHPRWCWECWLRRQPMTIQSQHAQIRLERTPPAERVQRVPQKEWPKGRRWCSGCQTMVSLKDVAAGASRCRACNSGSQHAAMIEKKYNISARDYNEILAVQGGRCAICRGRPISVRLATDHDHQTGVVRGLICKRCNHDLLGAAHDSLKILQNAVEYMRNPPTSGRWKSPEETKRSAPQGPPPF